MGEGAPPSGAGTLDEPRTAPPEAQAEKRDEQGDNASHDLANCKGEACTGSTAAPHPTLWRRVKAAGSMLLDGTATVGYGVEAGAGALATPETGPLGAAAATYGTAKTVFSADDVATDYKDFQGYDLKESVFTSAIREKFGDQAADAYAKAKQTNEAHHGF